MPDLSLLDRPIWSSLRSHWAPLALGGEGALKLDPEYGPFAVAADASPASLSALAALAPEDGEIWTVEAVPHSIPDELEAVRSAELLQMVELSIPSFRSTHLEIVALSEADAPEMLALATLTEPGPYKARTHKLGTFIGVRSQGQLISMAGERMRMPGLVEVSGVCTHPDYRGQGIAGALIAMTMRRIAQQGDQPFLHSYASNTGAVALYRKLGFDVRRDVTATILRRQ